MLRWAGCQALIVAVTVRNCREEIVMRKFTAILVLASLAFVPSHTAQRATPAPHTYKVADGGGVLPGTVTTPAA